MVKYVEGHFAEVDDADREAIIAALSAEAKLKSQADMDARDQELIAKGRELIVGEGCTRCHPFREHGAPGDAPDLTGYGSRDWLIAIIANPMHSWFYSVRNDRMPAYAEQPEKPAENRLSDIQLETLVNWMRGQWYEPGTESTGEEAGGGEGPVAVTLGKWAARHTPPKDFGEDPKGQALSVLRLAQCALCHDYSDGAGGGIPSRQPSAPSLYGFAGVEWNRGLLDPEQVAGPKYFGTNENFAEGEMVGFVQDDLADYVEEAGGYALEDLIAEAVDNEKQVEFAVERLTELKKEIGEEELRKKAQEAVDNDAFEDFVMDNAESLLQQLGKAKLEELIAALAAEAQKDGPEEVDEDTELLFDDLGCSGCHKFYNTGDLGSAPDLTGYGSKEWLVGIIVNPEDERFYPDSNDGMPGYHVFPDAAEKNLLTKEQIEQLADLVRGKLEP
jgi:ubiquinol-cytochrome c reductase cytochrome b subunit